MRTTLPHYGKQKAAFGWLEAVNQISGHETCVIAKTKIETKRTLDYKQRPDYQWVSKRFDNPRLAQMEAGLAALYALVEPEYIPKIRVLYNDRKEVIGTISKLFLHCVSLKEYLGESFGAMGSEAQTQLKLKTLVECGLAEVLTLSHQFEEEDLHLDNILVVFKDASKIEVEKVVRIDFDMSGFSVIGQPEFRGDRVSVTYLTTNYSLDYVRRPLSERYGLTDRDLMDFPELQDADPYYWPTKERLIGAGHGFSRQQIVVFKTLKEDSLFKTRSFLTRLKSVLFSDAAMKAHLQAHMDDPLCLEKSKRFIAQKNELRRLLLKNEKFKVVWEQLVEPAFSDYNILSAWFEIIALRNEKLRKKHPQCCVDLEDLKKAFYTFCRDMIEDDMLASFSKLDEFSKNIAFADSSVSSKKMMIDVQEVSISKPLALKDAYRSFFELSDVSSQEIQRFVETMNSVLIYFKEKRDLLAKDSDTKLTDFLESMEANLAQFVRHVALIRDPGLLSLQDSQGSVGLSSERFVDVAVLQLEGLVNSTLQWLKETNADDSVDALRNRRKVLSVFTQARLAYQQEKNTYFEQATNAVGYVASFFMAPVPTATTLFLKRLEAIEQSLCQAETEKEFFDQLREILQTESAEMLVFKKIFFSNLVAKFLEDFENGGSQVKLRNANLAEYLAQQKKIHFTEEQIKEVIMLLKSQLVTFCVGASAAPAKAY